MSEQIDKTKEIHKTQTEKKNRFQDKLDVQL